uniref:Peptidase S1 domain-containing protein n=1 Tax=Parascaris univalens TaxID=6257 RepID=A0A915B2T8_PARUN
MLFRCVIYSFIVIILINEFSAKGFRAIFIPNTNVEITRINDATNSFIKTLCGKSQPEFTDNGSIENYPWAVSITEKGKNKLGGVIISPLHILTAAHPFVRFIGLQVSPCQSRGYRSFDELQNRSVAYGGKCIRGRMPDLPNHPLCEVSDMQVNKIRSVVVDNDFAMSSCTDGHDWAIVELERPLIFTSKVRPICLPRPDQDVQELLTIFGWGRTNVFNESHPYLRETPMRRDPDCRAPWSDDMPTKAYDYVCTKSLRPDDYEAPRTCHGDSGSGMQQKDENGTAILIGITSFGTKGCPPNELARFTRVDRYLYEICVITGVCYSLNYTIY